MNYLRLVKSDLYDYAELKFACETLPERIAAEKAKKGLVQSSLAGIGDVKSRDYKKIEDKLISSMAKTLRKGGTDECRIDCGMRRRCDCNTAPGSKRLYRAICGPSKRGRC